MPKHLTNPWLRIGFCRSWRKRSANNPVAVVPTWPHRYCHDQPVPEPWALGLLAFGLLGITLLHRHQR